jgi:Ca2+/H+ antiporter
MRVLIVESRVSLLCLWCTHASSAFIHVVVADLHFAQCLLSLILLGLVPLFPFSHEIR